MSAVDQHTLESRACVGNTKRTKGWAQIKCISKKNGMHNPNIWILISILPICSMEYQKGEEETNSNLNCPQSYMAAREADWVELAFRN